MNFRKARGIFLSILALSVLVHAQAPTMNTVTDYNDWGWDAVVMENGLIKISVMPSIGARIMEYNLDAHKSIFVNAAEYGKTYTPSSAYFWPNFGGFKNWPAPQSVWNWTPPPVIDYGAYTAEFSDYTADSAAVFFTGEKEKWKTPGLRFKRRVTIYKGTSLVRVKQTIFNESTKADDWSVWDITQSIATHPGEQDYENFWVYFSIDPESHYGATGVWKKDGNSSAYKGEVAPGIYGVQFRPDGKKIFADSHEGWIAYVDEREGYAYFKVFKLWPEKSYPDDEAHVAVYLSSANPAYFEVEVMSPLINLAANGGSYTFIEDWYAAKMNGPILTANNAGAIAKRLEASNDSFAATYGVFYVGTARLTFVDASDNVLAQGNSFDVTPLRTFQYSESIAIPTGTARVQMRIYDSNGTYVGAVENVNVSDISAVKGRDSGLPGSFQLNQNFPNPFNPDTTIPYEIKQAGPVELSIHDVQGREVERLLSKNQRAGSYTAQWNAVDYADGVYLCRLQAAGEFQTIKMLLLK